MKVLFAYDIDGTLADVAWRHFLAGKEPSRKNWTKYQKWLKRVQNKKMLLKDKPIPGMKELVLLTQQNSIYITARKEYYRKVTRKWLKKNGFPELPLYMRPNKSKMSAGSLKEKILLNILKKEGYKDILIFDDDVKGDIAFVAKKRGWTFLKALSGS